MTATASGARADLTSFIGYTVHAVLVMPKIHYTRFPVANLLRLLEMVSYGAFTLPPTLAFSAAMLSI